MLKLKILRFPILYKNKYPNFIQNYSPSLLWGSNKKKKDSKGLMNIKKRMFENLVE